MKSLTEGEMEVARGICWILRFFSQKIDEQWKQLPDEMEPVVFVLGDYYAPLDEPIRILAIILSERLGGWGEYFDVDDPELDVLDDLRTLIYWFMLEGRDEIFARPEEPDEESIIGTVYMIWRVVRRLCSIALSRPSVQEWATGDFSFRYFLDAYTSSQ